MALCLNIGAGDVIVPGFIPIDRRLGHEAYPLPETVGDQTLADSSVDEIRASHVLEHFSLNEVPKVLGDWLRVLKPGGRIRLAVPDFDWIVSHRDNGVPWPRYLMGGQTDENDYHKSIFTEDSLRQLMEQCGIAGIKRWKSDVKDCAALPVSLNLEGTKAEQTTSTPIEVTATIAACITVPRLGWNDHWGCQLDVLKKRGIPTRRMTGAFWDQCMQTLFQTCVDDKLDWLLALDYDTMFSSKQFDKLLSIFAANPHIDALAALQPKRSIKTALFTRSGGKIVGEGQRAHETDGSPLQVETAHFGLTLLRVPAIADVPKPWFLGVPAPDGTWDWGDKSIHPDIYFWRQWEKAGKTLYITPEVRVGHLEVMVSEYAEDGDALKIRHRHVPDWMKEHWK